MDVKLKIEITQDTPSIIESHVLYYVISSGFSYNTKHLSQIGVYPKSTHGYNVYSHPTGLTIVPFVEKERFVAYDEIIRSLNDFINNPSMKNISIDLVIDKIDAHQTITVTKI